MNWRAIANALVDTVAIFYRLRILKFYDRKRELVRRVSVHADEPLPTLFVALPAPQGNDPRFDDATSPAVIRSASVEVRVVPRDEHRPTDRTWLENVLAETTTDVIAVLDSQMRIGDGWAEAGRSLMRDPSVAIVVGPTVPLLSGDLRHDAAAILTESRFGVGGARVRHHVGTLSEVDEFPARNLFVRRADLEAALEHGLEYADDLCRDVRGRSERLILCSPDVIALSPGEPLFAPYLGSLWRLGLIRGRELGRARRIRLRYAAPSVLVVALIALVPATLIGGAALRVDAVVVGVYALCVVMFATVIAALHRRGRVPLLAAGGAVASHVTFGTALIVGALSRLRRRQTDAVETDRLPGTPGPL
jgi:hypothetical protein